MKKLIGLIFLLIVLGGGYLYYDYSTSKEPFFNEIKEKIVEVIDESSRTIPPKKQVGQLKMVGPTEWQAYCESKGGAVTTENRDGEELMICFINDGKDGIRCQARLFYELKCGHGEPVAVLGRTVIYRNTDSTSNVAAVVVSENREGMTFLTKEVDGEKRPDRIVMKGNDGSVAEVVLNSYGLPSEVNANDLKVTFEEYSEDSVGLTVAHADGRTESITRTFDQSKFQAGIHSWFFPSAHAATAPDGTFLETLGDYISENAYDSMPIGVKAIHEVASAAAAEFCRHEEGDCFLYEMPDFGTAVSTIGCGIGLGSILFSGGATSPFAYMGCAALGVRFATNHSEIGPCEGDLLNCGVNTIIDFVQKEGFDVLPGVLSEGFKIHGIISNSVNREPVRIGTLNATSSGQADVRGDWHEGGSYTHYFRTGGNYTIKAVAEGYKDRVLTVQISSSKVRISDPNKTEEFEVGGKDYADINFDFLMEPEAYIVGEVIDSVEGEPIKDAKVSLRIGSTEVGKDATYDDGTFSISPNSVSNPDRKLEMVVTAEGYGAFTAMSDFSYQLKPKSDQYLTTFPEVIKLSPVAEDEVAEEDEEHLELIRYEGAYARTFSRPSTSFIVDPETQIGATVTETTTGTISVTVHEDYRATCIISMKTNFSTEIEGFDPVGGSGEGKSVSCSGSVDSDSGTLVLSGIVEGTLRTAGETETAKGAFNIVGQIQDRKLSGTLSVEGTQDIPF